MVDQIHQWAQSVASSHMVDAPKIPCPTVYEKPATDWATLAQADEATRRDARFRMWDVDYNAAEYMVPTNCTPYHAVITPIVIVLPGSCAQLVSFGGSGDQEGHAGAPASWPRW